MDADALLTELERIHLELELSRQRLGAAVDGLGAVREALDPAVGPREHGSTLETHPFVVSNVSDSVFREARANSDAIETARLRTRDVARISGPATTADATKTLRLRAKDIASIGAPLAGAGGSDAATERTRGETGAHAGTSGTSYSGQAERPAARTIPGTGPDSVETARVQRPAGLDSARVPRPGGKTLLGAGPDSTETARVQRPTRLETGRNERPGGKTLPGSGPDVLDTARVLRRSAGEAPEHTSGESGVPGEPPSEAPPALGVENGSAPDTVGDASEPSDERPTGEFDRPQRDTLTYFFGVDGPAPDEETELGPVGGPADPGKRPPDPS